ncbi:class I adenylate-forming enzyme family protein [Pseudoalteromonas sp. A757]|uniref:class I adenylate-forming enzyme family protein n=1 Tax=Pseudoalteromonas sp. A757 TaxID=2250709 RepID=UPI000FFF1615|nr:class I adenylate-forming enzyme family protein [Pseudoalteromonas sp. A757]RXE85351.1 long-chain fatty acid--CoA ligase [Pseudoalteromonas sp. A757]
MDNIYHLFHRNVEKSPDKVAIVFSGTEVTYSSLFNQVLILSRFFKDQGLTPGQRIALFAPNGIEYPVVLLAAAKLGLAVVPLPITLKGAALEIALKKTPVSMAICWPTVSRTLLESAVVREDEVITLGESVLGERCWEDILTGVEHDEEYSNAAPELDFILTMTSGSTGSPKPIVLSQKCKIERAFSATINYYQLTSDDVILVATPLYHSLAQRGVLMPLMLGATTVILPKFQLQNWLDAIEQYQVSFLFAVSSQLEGLVAQSVENKDISSVRILVSSSAVLNTVTKAKLLKLLSCEFHECYGASEVGVVTDFCIDDENGNQGSVGKPLPFVDVKICDGHRKPVEIGVVGEIACKTTTQFSGYLKQLEATKAAYDDTGYFYTGDLGYLNKEGFLFYVGRKKEVISSGGINIYPQDIEEVIKRHPLVTDCVAFGVADPTLGEVIKVVYEQANVQEEESLERALRKLCFAELTDYQQPRIIEKCDNLARNAMGKVLRQQVKETYS